MLNVLDGREIPAVVMPDGAAVPSAPAERPDSHEPGVEDLRYEVMFLLDAPDDKIEGFKTAWAEVGDSIVVVGGDGIWNCHIHSDDIGASIECAIDVGRPHKIRVTDLAEEVEEQAWVKEAATRSHRNRPRPLLSAREAVRVCSPERPLRPFGSRRARSGGRCHQRRRRLPQLRRLHGRR